MQPGASPFGASPLGRWQSAGLHASMQANPQVSMAHAAQAALAAHRAPPMPPSAYAAQGMAPPGGSPTPSVGVSWMGTPEGSRWASAASRASMSSMGSAAGTSTPGGFGGGGGMAALVRAASAQAAMQPNFPQ